MARLLDIEIESWAKFNPRSDRANYSWFRLDNTFFHDQSVFGLSSQDKLSYIFVLCELSKKNTSRVSLDVEYASALLKITPDEFCVSLKRLEFSKLIRCHDDGKKTARRRQAASLLPATRRDETDETRRDERSPSRPDGATPIGQVRESFLNAYKKEFNREYPGWGAKENGMVAKWLKSISLDEAKRLSALYPRWNDPWVTKQGHPLGVLVAQYVQLAAWASGAKHLIQKIAQGKAAENVDLKRAIEFEELKRGLSHRSEQQQTTQDLSDTRSVQKPLPLKPVGQISRERGDPFSDQVFDPPSENDSA